MEILTNFTSHFLSFILVLTILVFVHEFGHFWVARKAGVKIEIFSIGFGKEIFGFTDKLGTRWKFSLIPLGGYVKMFGDKNAASQPDYNKINKLSADEKKLSFEHKSLLIKSSIVAAGPISNYLFSILIFAFFFFSFGHPQASSKISSVVDNSPANKAGILPGDIITEINGQKITSFDEIRNVMALNLGEELKIKVNNQVKIVTPQKVIEQDALGNKIETFRIGIMTENFRYEKQGFFASIKLAIIECYKISIGTLKSIGQMIAGKRNSDELGGPIKIAQYSSKSLQAGFLSLLMFMGLLSVNLGLINLLPIPVLDGGHLLIYFVEAVLGKKASNAFQKFGFQIGIILLLFLTIFVTFNDLKSLIKVK